MTDLHAIPETPKFVYLLNAMENASVQENPSNHGYAGHRAKVLDYVEKLERALAKLQAEHEVEHALTAWSDDTALNGPTAPQWNGQIEHLIRYLLTIHKRFGNTAITADLQWGGRALRKRDKQKERIAQLEEERAAAVAEALERVAQEMANRAFVAYPDQTEVWAWKRAEKAIRSLSPDVGGKVLVPFIHDAGVKVPDGAAWSCIKERYGHAPCRNWCGNLDEKGALHCILVPKSWLAAAEGKP